MVYQCDLLEKTSNISGNIFFVNANSFINVGGGRDVLKTGLWQQNSVNLGMERNVCGLILFYHHVFLFFGHIMLEIFYMTFYFHLKTHTHTLLTHILWIDITSFFDIFDFLTLADVFLGG